MFSVSGSIGWIIRWFGGCERRRGATSVLVLRRGVALVVLRALGEGRLQPVVEQPLQLVHMLVLVHQGNQLHQRCWPEQEMRISQLSFFLTIDCTYRCVLSTWTSLTWLRWFRLREWFSNLKMVAHVKSGQPWHQNNYWLLFNNFLLFEVAKSAFAALERCNLISQLFFITILTMYDF